VKQKMNYRLCLLPLFLIWLLVAMHVLQFWNWSSQPLIHSLFRNKCHWQFIHVTAKPFFHSLRILVCNPGKGDTYLITYYVHDMITCNCQHFGWLHFTFIFWWLIYINHLILLDSDYCLFLLCKEICQMHLLWVFLSPTCWYMFHCCCIS
jgi:hypothetical protein